MKRQPVKIALALTAVLTLAGCSAGFGSDTAVSVEGKDYSVAELQQATAQLNTVSQQPSEPQQVLADLALLPLLDSIFTGSPREATDGSVRELLSAGGVTDPGPATLDAARSRQYQAVLSDPALAQDPAMADAVAIAMNVTAEDVAALDVDVNPRYGEWDTVNGGIAPSVPGWIRPASEDS